MLQRCRQWLLGGRRKRSVVTSGSKWGSITFMPDKPGMLIVTGASRGIGEAIARLASARGFSVAVIFSRAEAEARAIAEQITLGGGCALAVQADVSCEEDVMRLFEMAERELGPITALVNNAAITGGFARVDSVSAETLANVMAVNVAGAFLCAREAVRRMSTVHGGSAMAIGISGAARDFSLEKRLRITLHPKGRLTALRSAWRAK
jgi:NAD(P)-dependent dehydrogenase (short-subunit alcohol dehydrogenase family)